MPWSAILTKHNFLHWGMVVMWCQASVKTFYVDVDERREATLIHDDIRCQNIGQLFMNFEGVESWMYIVCLQVLWYLKFAIQWRWISELALVMERVYCCHWGGFSMNHADHVAQDWLVLGRWWSRKKVGGMINEGAQVIKSS